MRSSSGRLVSNYPMYSNVEWRSREEYAAYLDRAKAPRGRALRLISADGMPLKGLPPVLRSLDACATAYARDRPDGSPFLVEASLRRFSWDATDFVHGGKWTPAGRIGP